MPKLAAVAVNEAIRQLAQLSLSPQIAAALEAFLVAKRLEVKASAINIQSVNETVAQIFLVVPQHDQGRLQPFQQASDVAVRPKWGLAADSGRKTVWNTTTRGKTTKAAQLFEDNDIRRGLRKDAVKILAQLLQQRPNAEALQVFLLRDKDFGKGPTQSELDKEIQAIFGLSASDIKVLCGKDALASALAPTKDSPEWSPARLDPVLAPPALPTNYSSGLRVEASGSLVFEERVKRMVRLAILSSPAVMLVGPPGTGKTALLHQVIQEISDDPEAFGFTKKTFDEPYWATPEEGWTARDVVGGETLDEGRIRFRPGWVLQAISEDRWLVLDEANRADLDKIFGGLLTWLSGKDVKLGRVSPELTAGMVELGWGQEPESRTSGEEAFAGALDVDVTYSAGTEWRLLGTYNALDAQRVFRFGQALGRRFVRVPIPPISLSAFKEVVEGTAKDLSPSVRAAITGLYGAHLGSSRTALGPALFLRMPQYLRAGIPKYVEESASSGAIPIDVSTLIAEAYLANVGTWVARLDDSERIQLGVRITSDFKALSESEWDWVTQLASHLG